MSIEANNFIYSIHLEIEYRQTGKDLIKERRRQHEKNGVNNTIPRAIFIRSNKKCSKVPLALTYLNKISISA